MSVNFLERRDHDCKDTIIGADWVLTCLFPGFLRRFLGSCTSSTPSSSSDTTSTSARALVAAAFLGARDLFGGAESTPWLLSASFATRSSFSSIASEVFFFPRVFFGGGASSGSPTSLAAFLETFFAAAPDFVLGTSSPSSASGSF